MSDWSRCQTHNGHLKDQYAWSQCTQDNVFDWSYETWTQTHPSSSGSWWVYEPLRCYWDCSVLLERLSTEETQTPPPPSARYCWPAAQTQTCWRWSIHLESNVKCSRVSAKYCRPYFDVAHDTVPRDSVGWSGHSPQTWCSHCKPDSRLE